MLADQIASIGFSLPSELKNDFASLLLGILRIPSLSLKASI